MPAMCIIFFTASVFVTKTPLFNLMEETEVGVKAFESVCGGGGAAMREWSNGSTIEAAQPSSSKVTKSQWGKVI